MTTIAPYSHTALHTRLHRLQEPANNNIVAVSSTGKPATTTASAVNDRPAVAPSTNDSGKSFDSSTLAALLQVQDNKNSTAKTASAGSDEAGDFGNPVYGRPVKPKEKSLDDQPVLGRPVRPPHKEKSLEDSPVLGRPDRVSGSDDGQLKGGGVPIDERLKWHGPIERNTFKKPDNVGDGANGSDIGNIPTHAGGNPDIIKLGGHHPNR